VDETISQDFVGASARQTLANRLLELAVRIPRRWLDAAHW